MVWAAAVVATFLILVFILHCSGKAYHEFLCHIIKAIRILTISTFFIISSLFLQVC